MHTHTDSNPLIELPMLDYFRVQHYPGYKSNTVHNWSHNRFSHHYFTKAPPININTYLNRYLSVLVLVVVEEVLCDWLFAQCPDGRQSLEGDGEVGVHWTTGYRDTQEVNNVCRSNQTQVYNY